jgi:signal transduction histidine kinase
MLGTLLDLASLGSPDWESIVTRVVQLVGESLCCERVGYWSFSEASQTIRCECSYTCSTRTYDRGLVLYGKDHPPYFDALRHSRMLLSDDAMNDPRMATLRDYFGERGIVRMMDVPVWSDGRLAGVLCHEQAEHRDAWTAADQHLAIAAAQILSSALERHARTCAESAGRRSQFLDDVSGALLGTLDAREVVERAARLALPILGDVCLVDVLVGDGVERAAIAAVHADDGARQREFARRFPPRLDGPNLTMQAIRGRESLIIPQLDEQHLVDFPADERALVRETLGGLGSGMAVPLTPGPGDLLGALVVYARGRRYALEEIVLAEAFAFRVATALANAQLYAHAEQAVRTRDEFIAIASHELRTPLTSLMLSAETLASELASSENDRVRRASAAIVRQSRRLHQLVDRILDISRSGADRLAIQPASIDLSQVVHEVAQGSRRALERSGSSLQLDVDAGVRGHWDAGRLEQAISNLLDNAIKFGRGRPIEMSLHVVGDRAVLSVRDHGIGISPDDQRRVFERFERAVPVREFGGLGLGLYVTHLVVEAHGGTISVRSVSGEGSTFVVELPGVEHAT